jgi:hypothetical protein
MPYPVLPTPIAYSGTINGVFDPVTGTPPLQDSTGESGNWYVVSRAGVYNFVTGVPGSGTTLSPGDSVLYLDGTWHLIATGASGDNLPRDGSLPMLGQFDTGGHPVLLHDGQLRGENATTRALIVFTDLQGGDWAGRANLITVRARIPGNPSTVPLLVGELASDLTLAAPTLLIGIDNAGNSTALISAARQVELAGTQVITGAKTIRLLTIGTVGSEIIMPTTRGAVGQSLIQGDTGHLVFGSAPISAAARSEVLGVGSNVVDAFNGSGPFIFTDQDLVFLSWNSGVYLWGGGSGTFGLGAEQAEEDDIQGPILTAAGIAFATVDEVRLGVESAKAIAPDTAAGAFLLLDAIEPQALDTELTFGGASTISSIWAISSGGALNALAGAHITLVDLPRAGAPGLLDVVNRTALDNRFQPVWSTVGAGIAGKAPITGPAGKIDRRVVNGRAPMDYTGNFDPLSGSAPPLRNVAGAGLTPAATGGEVFQVVGTGPWNFTTGAADPSGTPLASGQLLLWDPVLVAWQVVGGGGGGSSGGALLRDGSTTMTGNLRLEQDLQIRGFAPDHPVTLVNAVLDAGIY